MARIGNWDVSLNKQGWFDITLADPLNGWFDKTAVGFEGFTISPPGIPSASVQGLPKVIQIVAAPGIPSAAVQSAPFVAQLVEPPGIPSVSEVAPAQNALEVKAPGIPSAQVVSAGEAAAGIRPPGIPSVSEVAAAEVSTPTPTTTPAHGGQPGGRPAALNAPTAPAARPAWYEEARLKEERKREAEAQAAQAQPAEEEASWAEYFAGLATARPYERAPANDIRPDWWDKELRRRMYASPPSYELVAGPTPAETVKKALAYVAIGAGLMWAVSKIAEDDKPKRRKRKTA
jgi:hypothetical protein